MRLVQRLKMKREGGMPASGLPRRVRSSCAPWMRSVSAGVKSRPSSR